MLDIYIKNAKLEMMKEITPVAPTNANAIEEQTPTINGFDRAEFFRAIEELHPNPISREEFDIIWKRTWHDYISATRQAEKNGGWKSDIEGPVPHNLFHRKTDF